MTDEQTSFSPESMVMTGMRAVLPPDAPLPFTSITRVRTEGHGAKRRAVADVVMFDGLPARLALWRHSLAGAFGWALEWLEMEGGGASYEDGRWIRVVPADDLAAVERRAEAGICEECRVPDCEHAFPPLDEDAAVSLNDQDGRE